MSGRTSLPQRPVLDAEIRVPISSEEKVRIFELAAKRRVSTAEFVRSAIARAEPDLAA